MIELFTWLEVQTREVEPKFNGLDLRPTSARPPRKFWDNRQEGK